MEGRAVDVTTATPREIDFEIARIDTEISKVNQEIHWANKMIFGWAGRTEWVRGTRTKPGTHRLIGTYEEAAEIARQRWEEKEAWHAAGAPQDKYPTWLRDASLPYETSRFEDQFTKHDALVAQRYTLLSQRQVLSTEYVCRGGWTRYYLVISSPGHIHATTGCSTCHTYRSSASFGWLPELSGLTVTDAVAAHGETLCSVCFPDAPVKWQTGKKITAAQALKRVSGPVITEEN